VNNPARSSVQWASDGGNDMPYVRREQITSGALLNIKEFGLCIVLKPLIDINCMDWVEVLLVNGDIEYLNPLYILEEELIARAS
jgi:hypothetical protein